jgi:hypothetical protein
VKQSSRLQPYTLGITHTVKALKIVKKFAAKSAHLNRMQAFVSDGKTELHYCL